MPQLALGFPGERFVYLPENIISTLAADELTADLYVCYVGYFAKAKYHYYSRPNGTRHFILLYCTDGCGEVVIGGVHHTLGANQFVILPAGIPHHYMADVHTPWSIYWLHFDGRLAKRYAEGFDCPTSISVSDTRIADRLNLLEEIYCVLDSGFERNNLCYANACLNHLLALLVYMVSYRRAVKCGEYNVSIINRVIHYMNENLEKSLKVEELADYIGYTSTGFSRKFHKETGFAPIDYFSTLKVNKACNLLLTTRMTISQIAHKLGYDDPYYFSRLFSKKMGVSPKRFRTEKGALFGLQ